MRGTVAKRLRRKAGKLATLTQDPGLLAAVIKSIKKTKKVEVFGATAHHTGYRRIYQDLKRVHKGLAPGPKPVTTAPPVFQAGTFVSHLMHKIKGEELASAPTDLIPRKKRQQSTFGRLFTQGARKLKAFATHFTSYRAPKKAPA